MVPLRTLRLKRNIVDYSEGLELHFDSVAKCSEIVNRRTTGGSLCAGYLFGRTRSSYCVSHFDHPKFMLRQRPLFLVIERQKVATNECDALRNFVFY
jgi:hypothetical protein